MLNITEINEEIERLENCDCTTYDVCKKLAILYIVRENYNKKQQSMTRSSMTTPIVS